MQKLHLSLFVLSYLFCIGCGGDGVHRVAINGQLQSDDGPIANASVQFIPEAGTTGDGALGMSDAEGKFTVISSRDAASGLPPGNYRVRISQMVDGNGIVLPAEATQAEFPDSREGIPAPYSTPNSPLEVTVTEDDEDIIIALPSAPRKK
ncbi:hypothetical protein EC9_14460 [Rosistilla ulvae]|uniref:Carboxypeptidase regulatory-like domain-containing protein n=1 Tax=Rosistilla ulvae TaxID=1930277 RepID=A0A517LXC2_9BACT|nr:carboxypeptidase-like regulatory domain-containing protein [Rosistilla ulvae]QDS87268.1 hypothetical protein EC9_14460 [Rosistilla ulvae]